MDSTLYKKQFQTTDFEVHVVTLLVMNKVSKELSLFFLVFTECA